MAHKTILQTQFWLSCIFLAAVLLVSNSVFTREFRFAGYNYAGKYSTPTVIGSSPKVKHLYDKKIEIRFRMKVNSVGNFDNVFQTAPANSGIRMELGGSSGKSFGLVIGDKKKDCRGFLITSNLILGRWYDVRVNIDRNKDIRVYLDNIAVIDESLEEINYDLSDIVIGTGFSRTRPFDGEIKDFSISGVLFYRLLPVTALLLAQLLAGLLFLISLFLVRMQAAVIFRSLAFNAGLLYSAVLAYYNRPSIKKFVKPAVLLCLPAALIIFSGVKVLVYPGFINSIAPDTVKYIAVIFLSVVLLSVSLEKYGKGIFIIFAPFVLVILAGKMIALFGLALFALASTALGLFLCEIFIAREKMFYKMCYGVLTGITINSYLIWVALHFKVNYPFTYYLFLGAQVVIFRKTLLYNIRKITQNSQTYSFTLTQKILFFLMTVHSVYALVPNYSWDELVAHFYLPKVLAMNGVFNFTPHYVPPFFNLSVVSMGAHSILFLIGGGEFAIRLFHWAIFYAAFFIFESFVRSEYGKRVSLFATLTLATTPYFLWCVGCPFIDSLALFSAVVVFLNSDYLMKNFTPRNILLFFALSCCAVFFKLQIIFLLIPVGIIILFRSIYVAYKDGKAELLKVFFVGCLLAVVFFLPIFLHNWIITKNPVFPMYNDFIKSPFYATEKPLPGFFKFKGARLRWNSLYDITFAGDKYYVGGNNPFLFGVSYFVFLWFMPLVFFARKRKKQLLLAAGLFFFAVLLCYFITGPQMRYFITSAPMGALVIGWLMDKLVSANQSIKSRSRILYTVFAGIFIVNFVCQINNSYLPSPYPLKEALTGDYSNSPRLKYWEDIKAFFKEVNGRYSRNTKALLYYSPAMYFADFNIEVLDWYNQLTVIEILRKYDTINDLYFRVFKEQKFDILIITDGRPATFLDDLIQKEMVRKGFSLAGYSVYTPIKEP